MAYQFNPLTGQLDIVGSGGGGGGTGTVTQVGLTMPSVFAVAGSPVTTVGTFAVTLATQTANTVWAGPASGAAATPTFRTLTAADFTVGGGANRVLFVDSTNSFIDNSASFTYVKGTTAFNLQSTNAGIGDTAGTGNDTKIQIVDSTGRITLTSNDRTVFNAERLIWNDSSGNNHLAFSATPGVYQFGDLDVVSNGTYLSLDDTAQELLYDGPTLRVTGANLTYNSIPYAMPSAQGVAGDALVIDSVALGVATLKWDTPTASVVGQQNEVLYFQPGGGGSAPVDSDSGFFRSGLAGQTFILNDDTTTASSVNVEPTEITLLSQTGLVTATTTYQPAQITSTTFDGTTSTGTVSYSPIAASILMQDGFSGVITGISADNSSGDIVFNTNNGTNNASFALPKVNGVIGSFLVNDGANLTNWSTIDNYILPGSGILVNFNPMTGEATIEVDGSIVSGLLYKGLWNASANTPTLASGVGTTGDFYIVNVAGTTTLDGISSWAVGDQLFFNGTIWQQIPATALQIITNGVSATSGFGSGNILFNDVTNTVRGVNKFNYDTSTDTFQIDDGSNPFLRADPNSFGFLDFTNSIGTGYGLFSPTVASIGGDIGGSGPGAVLNLDYSSGTAQLGDVNGLISGTNLTIDYINSVVDFNGPNGSSFNIQTATSDIIMGDIAGASGVTLFEVNDSSQYIRGSIGGRQVLNLDRINELYQIGRITGGNISHISINDAARDIALNSRTVTLSGVTYDWPNSDGTSGQVLTTSGTGALSWTSASGGVTTVGTINSVTPSANGAVISGSNIIFQSASATEPGMVDLSTQVFTGLKAFVTGLEATAASITGTGGAGYLDFFNQSSNPSLPSASFIRMHTATGRVIFSTSTARNTFTFNSTADRTYTLPDVTGTFAIINPTGAATGDIYYRDAGGAFTRLGIGSSGNILTVSGGIPAWTAGGSVTTVAAVDTITTGGLALAISGANINAISASGTRPGVLLAGSQTLGGIKTIQAQASGDIPLRLQTAASQTANAFSIINSASANTFSISADASTILQGSQTDLVGSGGLILNRSAGATNGALTLQESNGAAVPVINFIRTNSGLNPTTATTTGRICFAAYSGTAAVQGASITSNLITTASASNAESNLVFATSASGSTTPSDRMAIFSTGEIGMGSTPTTTSSASVTVRPLTTGTLGLRVTGLSGQTAGLFALNTFGGSTAMSVDSTGAQIFMGGSNDYAGTGGLIVGSSTTASSVGIITAVSNNNSVTVPQIAMIRTGVGGGQLLGGVQIGSFLFRGYTNASSAVAAASITATTGSAFTASNSETYMSFLTTASGTAVQTERVRIFAGGGIKVGTSTNIATSLGAGGFESLTTATIALQARGLSSQSADIFAASTSAGANLFRVAPTLNHSVSPLTIATASTQLSTAQLSVGTLSASNIGVIVRGVASQSGDLLQAQSSTPATLWTISANGLETIRTAGTVYGTNAGISVNTGATTNNGIIIRAQASQTADILRIESNVPATKFSIDGNFLINSDSMHNNAAAQTGAATSQVRSGTWTPTLTDVLNAGTLVARQGQWMRVGNVVTASVQFDCNPAGGGSTSIGISLPVASAFTTAFQAAGTGQANTNSGHGGPVISDATNDRAQFNFTAVGSGNDSFAVTFTYEVL